MNHQDPYDFSDDRQVTGVPDTSVGTISGIATLIILGSVFATAALTKSAPETKAPAEPAMTKQVSNPTAKP